MITRCSTPSCPRRASVRPYLLVWTNAQRDHAPAKFDMDDLDLCQPCWGEGKVHETLKRPDVRRDIEDLMRAKGRAKPCWDSVQVKFHPIQNNDAPEFTKRPGEVI